MKKVLFVLPDYALPVPNIKGGAIETLMTILLEENEKNKNYILIFISPNDNDEVIRYSCAVCYWCSNSKDSIVIDEINVDDCVKDEKYIYDYKAAAIAKYEKPDFVIMEGEARRITGCFDNVVPTDRMAMHLHCESKKTRVYQESFGLSIAPSQYIANKWISQNNNNKDYTVILRNVIKRKSFDVEVSKGKRELTRSSIGINEDDFLVFFCGRLIKEKGVKELVNAIININKNDKVKLLIVGSDSFADGNQSEYAKEIIELICDNNDIIYKGYVDNSKLSIYYKISDVLIVPSICEEAAGLVVLEGMISKVPIIITNSGGMVEYLNEENGFIIEKNDNIISNIADAILNVKYNKTEAFKKRNNAYLTALKYTEESYYKNFCEIIENWTNSI